MLKRFIPLVSLMIVLFAAGAVFSSPDLVVTEVVLIPQNPLAGETVMVTATVKNVGTSDAERRFNVRFLVNRFQVDAPSIPFGLDAGRSRTVSFAWTAEPGMHTIGVEADQPFDRIDESNEANNTLAITVDVPIDRAAMPHLADLKVVVARFDDRSGSGFFNVGEGVADKLVERLVRSGVRVLERSELEAVLQERGLNPAITENLTTAGQILGADLLIVGSITRVNIQQVAVRLGFLQVSSASVGVEISVRLVNARTSEVISSLSVTGSAEGATGFSVDLGKIFSLAQPAPANVCLGGLRTDRPHYHTGETVRIGYRNPGAPGWYGVEIRTTGGAFLRWLGWQFITTGGCGEWFWDQRDTSNMRMSPGSYIAKLWDGSSYIAAVGFSIRPGSGPAVPLIDEIRVGSGLFDGTIVGKAIDSTLNRLVTRLIQGMADAAPAVIGERGLISPMMQVQRPKDGQIAAILPDGRVVINIGASAGVMRDDFFQVLETENLIIDPNSGEILSYDLVGVKGEIVITEVRDRVSYGVRTTDFIPLIGAIVRLRLAAP